MIIIDLGVLLKIKVAWCLQLQIVFLPLQSQTETKGVPGTADVGKGFKKEIQTNFGSEDKKEIGREVYQINKFLKEMSM